VKTGPDSTPTAPGSILIIKLSAIGDVVHTLPVLEVLRESFPRARIDWVVEEAASDIVKGHPAVDEVIVSRRKTWQKALFSPLDLASTCGEVFRFIQRLRSTSYDIVLDLQGLFKSGVLAGIARGNRKVGMTGAREGAGLFLGEPPVAVDAAVHAVDRYLKLAARLGCDISRWDGRLPVTDADRAGAHRLLLGAGIDGDDFVAVNPVAKWETKLWVPARFSALCDRIIHETGCRVVFTGGVDDRGYVDGIIDGMRRPAVNIAGLTGLRELACVYERARLMVTTDTGPMHIAAAMQCPVVALFGPTAPGRTGPRGKAAGRVVVAGVPCSPCFRKHCGDPVCMTGIEPERVFNEAAEILIPGIR